MPLLKRDVHEHYMRMAISLALRGTGHVSPNPRVGCVLVDFTTPEGRPISLGYHRRFGGLHAEAEALKQAGPSAAGCTAYVNLEPCCHTGKTPPCANALIGAGVSRVVIGMRDPNPLVGGGGARMLADAGIEVIEGVLESECRWLNRGFIRNMTMGRPWVTVKAAISLDGDVALASGESKWITGAQSRRRAHMMRAENDAVMVGVGTVLADDPQLTVRDTDGASPMKAIVDRNLDTPPDASVLRDGKCVFFAGPSAAPERARALRERGADVINLGVEAESFIPPEDILRTLGTMGVTRLMIEGGARLIGRFIRSGAVDEYSLFLAPKLLGDGLHVSETLSFAHMGEAVSIKPTQIRKIGDDIWFEGIPSCSPAL